MKHESDPVEERRFTAPSGFADAKTEVIGSEPEKPAVDDQEKHDSKDDEHTSDSPEKEKREPIDFEKAFGPTIAASISPAMMDRIYNSERLHGQALNMMNTGLGEIVEQNPDLVDKLRRAFGIPTGEADDSERSHELPEGAPVGVPTTAEAVEASRSKSILRRLGKRLAGIGEGTKWALSSPIAASQHFATKFILHSSTASRDERWNDKFRGMSPEERKKHERRALRNVHLSLFGAAALYLAYRGHAFDFMPGIGDGNNSTEDHSGGGDQSQSPEDGHTDDDSQDSPEAEVETPPPHDYAYDPNEDPARDPAKLGNDWGTMPEASPEDGDKPAGWHDFFNNHLPDSPGELSATLSEFGLNGKDDASIRGLAEQMINDPDLFQQKHQELMDYLGEQVKNVSVVTDARDYGSYFAVANPDGTVTVSYDGYVDSASNIHKYGPQGNDFVVIELKDGSKHYAHMSCGWQWSHFINPAPAAPPPPVEVTPTPSYTPPSETPPPYTPPSSPPPQGPPVAPPETPPPSPPPPITPPEVPPPPSPPPEPEPPKQNHFPHPGDGTFKPAPAHTAPPAPPIVVEQTAPGGASSMAPPGTEHGITPDSGVGQSGPVERVSGTNDLSGDQGPPA